MVCSLGADKPVRFLMHRTRWHSRLHPCPSSITPLPYVQGAAESLRVSCAPSWDFFSPLGNVCCLLGKKIINLSRCTRLTRTLQSGDEVPKGCRLYICLSVVPQDTGWLSKFPQLLCRLTWGLYRTRLAATHLYFLIPLWTLEEDTTPNQWKILKKNQWCSLRYFKSFHLWVPQNALLAKGHCFPLSSPLSS